MKFNVIYFYKTALYLAVEKENIDIVKLLLTNDKLIINKKTALDLAIKNRYTEIVILLETIAQKDNNKESIEIKKFYTISKI